MTQIEILDNELYGSIHGLPKVGNYNEIWQKIKANKSVLKEAIKVKRNKWDTNDTLQGLAIGEAILIDYENIDIEIYQELINLIYSNEDIARIVLKGASNGGFSFLLMSLWNYDFKLTEEQKRFALKEAMNKIGTVKDLEEKAEFSKKLQKLNITDDITTTIDFDGSINPIGSKTKLEYFNYVSKMMSTSQAHGIDAFDIRYHILRNSNWSIQEKQRLIMDFWASNEVYDEVVESWEWEIVNNSANYKGNPVSLMEKELLYQYSYESLLRFYQDKKTTDEIWDEIQFCKLMHQLRPQTWELEHLSKEKKLC